MIEKLQLMTLMFVYDLRAKKSERGATATEYSLLVGLIALVLVVGVGLFGNALNKWFSDLSTVVAKWVTP